MTIQEGLKLGIESAKNDPINLDIYSPTGDQFRMVKPVTVLDIHQPNSTSFHEEGLFSQSIFGAIGSPERLTTFSFIDIKVPIIHPKVFRELTSAKMLYKDIMSGKRFATWDDKAKDFTAATEMDGSTGYGFFMKHWDELKLARNNSQVRDLKIDLVETNKKKSLLTKILVCPAGIRDYTIKENGEVSEDEVNELYRKLLSLSRTVSDVGRTQANDKFYDVPRWSLQLCYNDIYDHFLTIVKGKKGFIQGKWGSRAIYNGTRNVISTMSMDADSYLSDKMPSILDTMAGLFQVMKGALPLTRFLLKNGPLGNVVEPGTTTARVIDRKTLKSKTIELDARSLDKFTTKDGLNKLIDGYRQKELRHKPATIQGEIIALLYKDDKYFKVLHSIDDLPEGFSRDNVAPITYCELYYISCYKRFKDLRGFVTRYPITGLGSIYPTKIYVRSTVETVSLQPLDSNWEPIESAEDKALEFPLKLSHIDTIIPHDGMLEGKHLNAD